MKTRCRWTLLSWMRRGAIRGESSLMSQEQRVPEAEKHHVQPPDDALLEVSCAVKSHVGFGGFFLLQAVLGGALKWATRCVCDHGVCSQPHPEFCRGSCSRRFWERGSSGEAGFGVRFSASVGEGIHLVGTRGTQSSFGGAATLSAVPEGRGHRYLHFRDALTGSNWFQFRHFSMFFSSPFHPPSLSLRWSHSSAAPWLKERRIS